MQETNLKISPYFDDFDSSKNYQKILFKPGQSVQTRELNTLQTVLQNQVEKFGQHVFKDGSIVIPGNVNYDLTAKAVLIQSLVNSVSVERNLDALKGKILTGATSGVKAEVNDVLTAAESEKSTTTLYVAYNYGGVEENNVQLKEFKNNEILLDSEGNAVAVTAVQNATAYTGSTATINAGVYFVRGFFVEVSTQKIILEQYNINPSYKVGLQIVESLVTSEEDNTLYDNSLGSTNFASPGADRLQIKLNLVKQDLLVTDTNNFIELLRFEDGEITQQADAYQSAYAQLEKNLARRTYANHGSFTTQPYSIKIREALNDGTNGGVYYANEISYDGKTVLGGDSIPAGFTAVNTGANEYTDGTSNAILGKDYYAIELSEGKAYVEGFEVLNERKQYTLVPKPRNTQSLNNQGSILNIGQYLKVAKNSSNVPIVSGSVNFNDSLYLKDVDDNTIGLAKALCLTGDSRLYLTDVSVFEVLVLASVSNVSIGDFITGASSGATGFVHSITSGTKTVVLKQVTGQYTAGESLESSRSAFTGTTVTSRSAELLENIRKVEKSDSNDFSATIDLDAVALTGASFTVATNGIATVDTIGAADTDRTQGTYNIGPNDYTTQFSGFGASFTVVVDAVGGATITVVTGSEGRNFVVDETITIPDNKLGTGGAAALTFDVATVSTVHKVTGVNTSFIFELSSKSSIKLGGEDAVEVDSLTSDVITLSSSVNPNTYYSAFKQVCKLYSSANGLTSRVSLNPIKEQSDYIHSRVITESIKTSVADTITIQSDVDTVIDKNSVIVLNSTGAIPGTVSQTATNTINITGTGLAAGSDVVAYYGVRFNNPKIRKKTRQNYKFLTVNKAKTSSNNNYGTRYSDKEISLKFPDVIKIHSIHEAINDTASSQSMFDRLKLNDASQISLGDLITFGTIRARVISKSSNTVYVKYLSNTKFQSGTNLTIAVNIVATSNITGIFIQESKYGKYNDVTDDFKLVRNDTDNFYRVSKLVRKSSAAVPQKKLVVLFDYFEHDDLSNDFYSVDSYGDMRYEDIPLTYKYQSMADVIDFRYYVQPSTVSNSGSVTDPYVESATNSAFNIYESTFAAAQKVPSPGSVFSVDYGFYTGRVDKVYLTASNEKYGYITGLLRVVQGSDSLDPDLADDEGAGLLLATINLPPYLKDVSQAKITLEKTRNYTMKDIGKLEDRIINLEEYTTLSLLEVSTNNLNILDEEGRNRFKNGFVVDSFTTPDVADLSNPDFSASLDLTKNIVRPYPAVNNIGIQYSSSESTTKMNRTYVTLPYEETPLVSQTYSSRVENLFPYEVFSWVGNMDLFPKKDIWYDTKREIVEGQSINLVDSYTALFDLVVPGGEIWGNWQLGAGGTVRGGGGTTVTDIMEGTGYDVSSLNFDLESGDTIQNVTDIKYSRSRIVNISTTMLKPNTRFYFYINDVESSDIIYPKLLTNLTERTGTFLIGEKVDFIPLYDDDLVRTQEILPLSATVVTPSTYTNDLASIGYTDDNGYDSSTSILAIDQLRSEDDSDINPAIIGTDFKIIGRTSGAVARSKDQQSLYTDAFGNLNAFVLIPPTTFETGDLTFSVSDIPGNLQVKGITGSYAIGQYYSQGTELNVTANITTLEVPELTATAITQERTRFIPDPPPRPAGHDPIAQSFFIGEEGVFITSIELFFLTKDATQPVTVDIRTMENGTPTSFIIPGSIVTVQAEDVNTSTDASVGTKFVFDNPLFLASNNSYSFITRTTNKNYNMWVSRLGEPDVTTGLFIDKQPAVGVLYKSSNQSIWTPDQYEDVKFILNRAKFETNSTFTAVLPNTPVVDQKLMKNPFKFVDGSSTVKVFQPNHGMHATQNKVKLSNIQSDILKVTLTSSISGNTTTIGIDDVSGTTGFDPSTEGWSVINNASVSVDNPGFIKVGEEIISYSGITGSSLTGCLRGQLNTVARSHQGGAVVECFQVNGVRLDQINKIHTISKVISMDEYEIVVANNANITKQSGGGGCLATRNVQFETITPNLNIFSPTSTTVSTNAGMVTGTSIGNTKQVSFKNNFGSPTGIDNRVENVLTEPKLVLSKPNLDAYLTNFEGSFKTYVNMSTTSDRVSPVLDLAGSSITTISNRINRILDSNNELDLTSELTPTGGLHSAYITKKVVLETSSTSVKVLFDGIRTQNNDIKIFVKIKGDSNPGAFDDMNYIEVPAVNYPVSKNNKEFRAFDYEIKSLREFQEFSIKMVMIGNDQSDIPKIRNFRALALAL